MLNVLGHYVIAHLIANKYVHTTIAKKNFHPKSNVWNVQDQCTCIINVFIILHAAHVPIVINQYFQNSYVKDIICDNTEITVL